MDQRIVNEHNHSASRLRALGEVAKLALVAHVARVSLVALDHKRKLCGDV